MHVGAAQHDGAGELPGLEAHGPTAVGKSRLVGDEEVPAAEAVDGLAFPFFVAHDFLAGRPDSRLRNSSIHGRRRHEFPDFAERNRKFRAGYSFKD